MSFCTAASSILLGNVSSETGGSLSACWVLDDDSEIDGCLLTRGPTVEEQVGRAKLGVCSEALLLFNPDVCRG